MEKFPSRKSSEKIPRTETPFDPQSELKSVLAAPNRTKALKQWKETYAEQRRALARIQAELIKRVRENPDTTRDDLTAAFDEAATEHNFSSEQKELGHAVIEAYDVRHEIIRRVRKEYPNDRDLCKAVFGVTPIGPVKVIEGPVSLDFRCSNKIDSTRLVYFNKSGSEVLRQCMLQLIKTTHGAALHNSTPRISDLRNAIIVTSKDTLKDLGNVHVHEEQHQFRELLMDAYRNVQEKHNGESQGTSLEESKNAIMDDIEDELLAMMKGGMHARNAPGQLSSVYVSGFIEDELWYVEQNHPETLKIIEPVLKSKEFRVDIFKKVSDAAYAYRRITDSFTHEEAVALLAFEPLQQWPKLAKRLTPHEEESDSSDEETKLKIAA